MKKYLVLEKNRLIVFIHFSDVELTYNQVYKLLKLSKFGKENNVFIYDFYEKTKSVGSQIFNDIALGNFSVKCEDL